MLALSWFDVLLTVHMNRVCNFVNFAVLDFCRDSVVHYFVSIASYFTGEINYKEDYLKYKNHLSLSRYHEKKNTIIFLITTILKFWWYTIIKKYFPLIVLLVCLFFGLTSHRHSIGHIATFQLYWWRKNGHLSKTTDVP
jgi:hypothetical protein